MDNQMIQEMNDIRTYLEVKYGDDYLNAITKLNSPQFDDNGLLKPDCALTDKEVTALVSFNPELSEMVELNSIKPLR